MPETIELQTIDTVKTRQKIGFADNRHSWQNEPAHYSQDDLTIAGHPVMERWEAPYMKALARIACSNGGKVLELGFGMGISAGFIHQEKPKEHHIVEANNDVYNRLLLFAAQRSQYSPTMVQPMQGLWQDVVAKLPDNSYDGILFDTYPLSEDEIHCNHFSFFKQAHRILKKGGILTYYSDEAVDYSDAHLAKLLEAGFRSEDINKAICPVTPPEDCQYWQANSLLVPIITKS